TARFRCVLALAPLPPTEVGNASPVCYSDELEVSVRLFEGVCGGKIAAEPSGKSGFGYDPLFMPDGFDQTFADLGEAIKNRISHRAKALEEMRAYLSRLST
ncbi:MAG: non-canonical purine NTP pyrophosphatase, partial [Verrucomicrobia bacterium]|nr:non-canonical purine NTP pyrophosphatase [Verrucomicrobiota bacterium]